MDLPASCRYKNMYPLAYRNNRPYYDEKVLPLLDQRLMADKVFPLGEPFDISSPSGTFRHILEFDYAFGSPMEEVVGNFDKGLRLLLRMAEELAANPGMGVGDVASVYEFMDLIMGSLLIDRRNTLDKLAPCIDPLCANTTICRYPGDAERLRLVWAMGCWNGDSRPVIDAARDLEKALAKDSVERLGIDDERSLGSRDALSVNAYFKHQLEYFRHNPDDRVSRKKNRTQSDVISSHLLVRMALAVQAGIPITLRHSALPIWDFPIAQRPELKELLPSRPT